MSAKKITLIVFAITMSYAVLRYHFLESLPASDIPFFILNKALAYSGLILFGVAGLRIKSSDRHQIGMAAAYCLLAHVLITLTLFSADYFPKFLVNDGSRLTLYASLSLLCGVIAFGCLVHLWRVSISTRKGTELSLVQGLGRILLIFAAGHSALMGVPTWFNPSMWPGSLPPITMLAFATALIMLGITHQSKRSND